jgi:hypothetical protein
MKSIPIETPFTQQFFSGYLIDHFLYKQCALYNIIDNLDKLKPDILKGLEDIDDTEFVKTLRLEIRATYFQAIETLFELIFSLEPRTSVIDNRHIWYYLSTSEWRENYKRIESIAEGDTAFLDRIVYAGEELKIPFIQYLFYFGVSNPDMLDSINKSFDPIKKFLVSFAQEFSDRAEYNAFKHALRILPAMQKFEVGIHGSEKPTITLDMSNSFTYIAEEGESISFRTKPIDTIRDMKMGSVCSCLISNIIRSRRVHFVKNYEGRINIFSDEAFPLANERNVNWSNFKFTVTPIYDSSGDENQK